MNFRAPRYVSGRELRRKNEREERRTRLMCTPMSELSPAEREQANKMQAMMDDIKRNGISPRHLQEEYDRGVDRGIKAQQEIMQRKDYAALAMALKRVFKFGPERITRVMKEFDSCLLELIPDDALVDEYLDQCGIELNFKEVFTDERIRQAR